MRKLLSSEIYPLTEIKIITFFALVISVDFREDYFILKINNINTKLCAFAIHTEYFLRYLHITHVN